RELVELVMRDEGHAVTTAGGGSEALEVAQRNRFDVAIVDYQMPAPNGLEVLARMRVMQPNCVGLLVSGNLDLDAAIQAVNRGEAARILTKPFSVNDLLGAVGEAVQARRRIGEHFLSSSTAEYSQEAMQFEECLALNHLRLALQPIVSAATGEVVAHEA